MNQQRRNLIWQAPVMTTLLVAGRIPAGAVIGYGAGARAASNSGVILGDPSTYVNGTNPDPPYTPGDGRECLAGGPWWVHAPINYGCWAKHMFGL